MLVLGGSGSVLKLAGWVAIAIVIGVGVGVEFGVVQGWE